MKLNLLKGFAAVAMLCMIGAVFATPVALGDIGAAYVLYEASKVQDKKSYIVTAGATELSVVAALLPEVIATAAGASMFGPAGMAIGATILV